MHHNIEKDWHCFNSCMRAKSYHVALFKTRDRNKWFPTIIIKMCSHRWAEKIIPLTLCGSQLHFIGSNVHKDYFLNKCFTFYSHCWHILAGSYINFSNTFVEVTHYVWRNIFVRIILLYKLPCASTEPNGKQTTAANILLHDFNDIGNIGIDHNMALATHFV